MAFELEQEVQRALAVARAGPGLAAGLSEALARECAAALCARLAEGPDPAATLAALHLADLLLALGCARGDPLSLDRFHQEVLAKLPALVASARAGAEELAEVQQRLVDRLLLGGPEALPAIGAYEGRAPLAAWVRVAAVRAVSNVRRDRATYERKIGEADAPAPLAALDPELASLRRRFGESFGKAFQASFAALEAEDRTLLRLHYLDGLAVGRAARAVGISRATAFRRLLVCRAGLVDGTLTRLGQDLRLPREELESLLRTVRSKLELSLGGLLREGSQGPGSG